MSNVLVLFVFLSSFIYSQNFLVVDSLDKNLINLTFNDEHAEVKHICDSLISLDSKNPKYYFHYFGADALQLHEKINHSPLSGRDSLREILVDLSIEKLDEAIQILDDVPMTPKNRFYIASLHGYYSRFSGLNRSWWSAYVSGTKANKMFEELIEEYPECYDAYLYPGVFGYYAARLNGFTGFIATILGVSGNRIDGMNYIELALKNGILVYPQALLMILEINTIMEDNPHKTIPYFERFLEEFPKNKRTTNWYGHTLLNIYKTDGINNKINGAPIGVIDNFVKSKYFFLTEQLDSSAKYSKNAFNNPNTWRGIIEHTKYYSVYTNWLLKKNNVEKNYNSNLSAHYLSLFELDLNNQTESRYIYKLTSALVNKDYLEFTKLSELNPKFKEVYFEAEFNLLQGVFLFQQNKLNDSLPYFEKAEKSSDWRKRTIALRYQLDVYLKETISLDKVLFLIEKIEETDYNKLVFRLDDLREKYLL